MLFDEVFNRRLPFRHVKLRTDSAPQVKGRSVPPVLENSLDELSVGGNALIHVHLQSAKHDRKEAITPY